MDAMLKRSNPTDPNPTNDLLRPDIHLN